jgi:hypothetical protein
MYKSALKQPNYEYFPIDYFPQRQYNQAKLQGIPRMVIMAGGGSPRKRRQVSGENVNV